MGATFEDAAVGWQTFLARDGKVSRPQLNLGLRARGQGEISDRTYAHYNKLLRLGYTDYVSINRLDIRHANPSVFDVADRSRYPDREYQSPGRLLVPRASGIRTMAGNVMKVSDGFAVLRVEDTVEARTLSRATLYKRGVLVFEQVGVERAIEIAEGVPQLDGKLDLLLAFRSLLETELLVPGPTVAVSDSRIVVNLGPNPPLSTVLQVVQRVFDLYESSRGFAEMAMKAADPNIGPLPTPRIRRLEVSNPAELIIGVAIGVVVLTSWIISHVSQAVQATADAAASVQAYKNTKLEGSNAQELHELRVRSLQLSVLKDTVEIGQLLGLLPQAGEGFEGLDSLALDGPLAEQLKAMKNQAIEAGGELAVTSDTDIQFEIGDGQLPPDTSRDTI